MGIMTEDRDYGNQTTVRINAMDCYMYIPVKEIPEQDDGFKYATRIVKGKTYYDKIVPGVEGQFVKVEPYKYHSEEMNEDREGFNIVLKDGGETFVVSTGWTTVAQSIANSLAGTPNLGRISLKVYGKSDEQGRVRPRASMKNNGNFMEWKYPIDAQKQMITYTEHKGKKLKDDTKFVEQLKADFDLINDPVDPSEEDLSFMDELNKVEKNG